MRRMVKKPVKDVAFESSDNQQTMMWVWKKEEVTGCQGGR
jgi:hypothetical protein